MSTSYETTIALVKDAYGMDSCVSVLIDGSFLVRLVSLSQDSDSYVAARRNLRDVFGAAGGLVLKSTWCVFEELKSLDLENWPDVRNYMVNMGDLSCPHVYNNRHIAGKLCCREALSTTEDGFIFASNRAETRHQIWQDLSIPSLYHQNGVVKLYPPHLNDADKQILRERNRNRIRIQKLNGGSSSGGGASGS